MQLTLERSKIERSQSARAKLFSNFSPFLNRAISKNKQRTIADHYGKLAASRRSMTINDSFQQPIRALYIHETSLINDVIQN